MKILLQKAFSLRGKARGCLFRFNACGDALGLCRVYGIIGLLILGFSTSLPAAEDFNATVSIQLELADEFSDFACDQCRISVFLLDDRQDISGRLIEWKEESKAQLEPLVKEYMYTAELLTRLAVQEESAKEKEQAVLTFHKMERRIQRILNGYADRIDRLLQKQTLQSRREEGQAVRRIEFHELSPGSYRVYVVLTFATTTLQWFEALTVQGGDIVLCTLTRENLNNPYWTDLNWWKFINLDFSKHH